VPLPERPGHVEATRDWPCRLGARRATPACLRRAPEVRSLAVADPLIGSGLARQCRIGIVDLGHTPGRGLDGRRIVPGQVRVVRAGEPPPSGLDLAWGSAALDTED
jgi:hypothetical protein